jgi:hypothetical protein
MIVFDWLNSLNNWQQAIIGIPYAIIIAGIIIYVLSKTRLNFWRCSNGPM